MRLPGRLQLSLLAGLGLAGCGALSVKPVLLATDPAGAEQVESRNPFSDLREEARAAAVSLAADGQASVAPPVPEGLNKAVSHTLRICNAFPQSGGMTLSVWHGRDEISMGAGLAYKACEDFEDLSLRPGDHIRFRDGSTTAGIFQIGNLPTYSSTLLLVLNRHDTLLDSLQFESHIFKNLRNAQVAVIDAFRGSKKGRIEISEHVDEAAGEEPVKGEKLKYGGVHKLNTGFYDLKLYDILPSLPLPQLAAGAEFVVLPSENYVVLRVGVEDRMDAEDSFAEELVVFPSSSKAKLVEVSPSLAKFVSNKYLVLLAVAALASFAVARQFITKF